ncbi:hypothetical protein C8R44DRAFT_749655 [Mycena epipterygia]|nr:hypothetical protein C8R44DRAFT_749655 [Mycena epipterygia]
MDEIPTPRTSQAISQATPYTPAPPNSNSAKGRKPFGQAIPLHLLVGQLLVPSDVLPPGNFDRNSVPYPVPDHCVAVYAVSTSISSGVIQFWLARMVFKFKKQWIWIPAIMVFIFAGLTGAAATAGLLVIDSSSAAHGHLVK